MTLKECVLSFLRHIASYLSKLQIFPTPRVLGVYVGATALEFHHDLWRLKLESVLSCGIVFMVIMFSRFDGTPACDRQPDRHKAIAYTALA